MMIILFCILLIIYVYRWYKHELKYRDNFMENILKSNKTVEQYFLNQK